MSLNGKRTIRRFAAALLLVLIGVGIDRAVVAVYDSDPCDTVVNRTIPSPDGKTAMVIFGRECGATVPFNTQVSLTPGRKSFSPHEHPSFLSMREEYDLDARWVDDTSIEIALPPDAKIYRKDANVDGIAVTYR